MNQTAYDSLNVSALSESAFQQGLQEFAIRQRLAKVLHYRHVAAEIMRLGLSTQFAQFIREKTAS